MGITNLIRRTGIVVGGGGMALHALQHLALATYAGLSFANNYSHNHKQEHTPYTHEHIQTNNTPYTTLDEILNHPLMQGVMIATVPLLAWEAYAHRKYHTKQSKLVNALATEIENLTQENKLKDKIIQGYQNNQKSR